jgi:hypothetical protein
MPLKIVPVFKNLERLREHTLAHDYTERIPAHRDSKDRAALCAV